MICLKSLIILFMYSSLTAQIRVYPDSVVAIRDDVGNIGFIFPKKYATEYANLKKEMLNSKALIDSLTKLNELQLSNEQDLKLQIGKLNQVVSNKDQAITEQKETLAQTDEQLVKLKRRLSLWKIGTGVLSVAGFVIGIALGK